MAANQSVRFVGFEKSGARHLLAIHNLENGQGALSGALPDQAALIGILNRIHALNLTMLSVSSAEETLSREDMDNQ